MGIITMHFIFSHVGVNILVLPFICIYMGPSLYGPKSGNVIYLDASNLRKWPHSFQEVKLFNFSQMTNENKWNRSSK